MSISAPHNAKPVVMSIAGADPTSGAGIQADLLVINDFGLYPVTVVTAITAQDTRGVISIVPVESTVVAAQLNAIVADMPVAAVKIGMLATTQALIEVARFLNKQDELPVVIDPIINSTSGFALFPEKHIDLYVTKLLPLASAITPNCSEAEKLLQSPISSLDAAKHAAIELGRLGPRLVIVTGFVDEDRIIDIVCVDHKISLLSAAQKPYIVHGTGCIYSSALTCALIKGSGLREAAGAAHGYTQERIANALSLGRGSRLSPTTDDQ